MENWENVIGMGIPFMGMLMSIIIVFLVFYFKQKETEAKQKTIIEVSKNINDPAVVEQLLKLQEENKPIKDYKKSGAITLFVGIGLYLFGFYFLGNILQGAGALVAAIGAGVFIAGFFPEKADEGIRR